MRGGATHRGTTVDQDSRYKDKHAKLLRQMRFPPSFDVKVTRTQFNLDALRPWIAKRITALLELEDDVVIEYAISLLETDVLDAKDIQINLQGFLYQHAPVFVAELWELLMAAQASPDGIPPILREAAAAVKQEEEREQKRERVIEPARRREGSRERVSGLREEDGEEARGSLTVRSAARAVESA